MRQWSERHILELINKVIEEYGAKKGSGENKDVDLHWLRYMRPSGKLAVNIPTFPQEGCRVSAKLIFIGFTYGGYESAKAFHATGRTTIGDGGMAQWMLELKVSGTPKDTSKQHFLYGSLGNIESGIGSIAFTRTESEWQSMSKEFWLGNNSNVFQDTSLSTYSVLTGDLYNSSGEKTQYKLIGGNRVFEKLYNLYYNDMEGAKFNTWPPAGTYYIPLHSVDKMRYALKGSKDDYGIKFDRDYSLDSYYTFEHVPWNGSEGLIFKGDALDG